MKAVVVLVLILMGAGFLLGVSVAHHPTPTVRTVRVPTVKVEKQTVTVYKYKPLPSACLGAISSLDSEVTFLGNGQTAAVKLQDAVSVIRESAFTKDTAALNVAMSNLIKEADQVGTATVQGSNQLKIIKAELATCRKEISK
jgi:hypothetical protein